MLVPYLAAAFTLWMAVAAVRRGDAGRWLWIILLFGPLGAAVYFFSVYLEPATAQLQFRLRRVTRDDLRRAEAEVKRLDNAATWTEYASLLRARRDFPRAALAAQKALERKPGDPDASYELGLALLEAGRPAEALLPLENVVAQDRSFDSDDAFFALAKARVEAGQLPEARNGLEELAERRGRPEILYELAGVQARLGDREAALRSLHRIVDEAELVPAYLKGQVRPWVRRARAALRKLGA